MIAWSCGPLLCLLASGLATAAESSKAEEAGVASSQVLDLEYQELNYSLQSGSVLNMELRSTAFKKEPDFRNSKFYRGMIYFSPDQRDNNLALPFAWDRTRGKLYLDLNRNGDLTDDPDGARTALKQPAGLDGYQEFPNVRLTLGTPTGVRRYLVDLHVRQDEPLFYVDMKSYWRGKLAWEGQEWEIGVVEALPMAANGSTESLQFLARPWKDRGKPFQSQDLEGFTFTRPVFLQNRGYDMNCTFRAEGEKAGYRLEFKEQRVKLGELRLTGKFLKRVFLKQNLGWTVLLDEPGAAVQIPVGEYPSYGAILEAGNVAASFRYSGRPKDALTIAESGSATLALGGPLTNMITVHRQGKYLILGYDLQGADGNSYRLSHPDPTVPPHFAVYQGDKQIASRQFRFG